LTRTPPMADVPSSRCLIISSAIVKRLYDLPLIENLAPRLIVVELLNLAFMRVDCFAGLTRKPVYDFEKRLFNVERPPPPPPPPSFTSSRRRPSDVENATMLSRVPSARMSTSMSSLSVSTSSPTTAMHELSAASNDIETSCLAETKPMCGLTNIPDVGPGPTHSLSLSQLTTMSLSTRDTVWSTAK